MARQRHPQEQVDHLLLAEIRHDPPFRETGTDIAVGLISTRKHYELDQYYWLGLLIARLLKT